jgi:alcohol dehydrogenase class IV
MTPYTIKPLLKVGSLLELVPSLPKSQKILIISSPSVFNNIKVDKLQQTLIANGHNIDTYTKIKPDAPLDDLDFILSNFQKPDIILAIGGGSVIDSSKALSVGWQSASIRDYFDKKVSLPQTKIYTIAVPTTAGTGAELSYGAIIYDVNNGVKGGLRGAILQPNEVVLDIELYLTAPNRLIAEVGFDCLTHAIETYLSTAASPLVRYNSISVINTVFSQLVAATNKDRGALEKMAIAASIMGVNLALSTTCLPHRIQYVIGPITNTSHAQGLIMIYRGWLPIISQTAEFEQLCLDLGISTSAFNKKITMLKAELEIDYKLSDYGIGREDIELLSSKVTGNVGNDPCYKSLETINEILKLAI